MNRPVAAFCSPTRALWGVGELHPIEVQAPWAENYGVVAQALRSFGETIDSLPGTGPIAFGCLPFDRNSPATFYVAEEALEVVEQVEDSELPSSVEVRAVVSASTWCEAVSAARQRIAEGELTKVVLARELEIRTDRPIDPTDLFLRLRRLYPNSMCFTVDGFVGASPELLVARTGDTVRAQPMAGTIPRSGDPETDSQRAAELLSSTKNRTEHQITIDMVHETLLPWCSYLDSEPTPSVVPAGPVQHLATMVEGKLSRPLPNVVELVAALHPTPAVGGWPTSAALSVIAELESSDRGSYAGPVGWVDSDGNGEFAVGIRSVQVGDKTSHLFAGVGVVADSDPLVELAETRAKAQALLGAIVRV